MNLFNRKPSHSLKTLFKAVKGNDERTVKEILKSSPYFVDAKIDNCMTPLKTAAACGNLNMVKLLVERGAEVYSNSMASYPAIMDAAWNKHQTIVDYFLNEIPDRAIGTNELGVTINLAGRQGWIEIVKKHIEMDPLSVHQRGWIGDTPLHWPCHNDYVDIVELLIDNGADIEADEINWIGGKPLHWASEHARNTTKILLENGATVNSRNEKKDFPCYGRTPLIHNSAQKEDCSEITEILLKAGADLNAIDAAEKTALQWAKEKKNTRIETVLKSI